MRQGFDPVQVSFFFFSICIFESEPLCAPWNDTLTHPSVQGVTCLCPTRPSLVLQLEIVFHGGSWVEHHASFNWWSADAGLVFTHFVHLCFVEGFIFSPPLNCLSHKVGWSSLHPRMHLSLSDLHGLMITFPVRLCLKASRQY